MFELSIITVCYNACKQLKETLDSVLSQIDYPFFSMEYLVIDNVSEDGTEDLVYKYQRIFAEKGCGFRYIRESDNGIYDAMNKGIQQSRGRWLMLLNAGDTLYDDAVLKKINGHLCDGADVLVGSYKRMNPYESIIVSPPEIEKIRRRMIFCHQAVIFSRSIHQRYLYRMKYKIVADYDAILRMYLAGVNFEYIDCCIVNYDVTGLSASRMVDTHKEIHNVRRDNNVISEPILDFFVFQYGLIKRKVLLILPNKLRWKLVSLKNRVLDMRYI